MPTYFVVNSDVTDADLLARYRAAVGATFEGHDVEVLASTDVAQSVEGSPAGSRVVILRFPDADGFRAWYDSPAYRAIIDMRTAATDGFAVLADGRT
jgi:uncharacterized protein (DUF1330 family)